MKIRIKIQGFLVFLSLALSVLLSKFFFPHWKAAAMDEFTDALGIGLVFLGILIRIAARGHKSEISSDGHKLIKTGPYGLLRNPMYFGTLLIGSGIVLVLLQLWALVVFIVVFLLIYIPQIAREEDRLYKLFGQEYRDYCGKTPRFFPNTAVLFKSDVRDYLSFKWPWMKKELPSLISIIAVIIALETWEDVRFVRAEILLVIFFFIAAAVFLYKKKESAREK